MVKGIYGLFAKWLFVFTLVLFSSVSVSVSDGWCQGLEWLRSFGAEGSDAGSIVQQTNDGGYIFIGTTESFGAGETDAWLVKTDRYGMEIWSRTFGGEFADMGKAVMQTSDGGFIITGATRSYGAGKRDVWLIKTDRFGNEQWSRTFGGSEWDFGRSVQQTSDGGYIIAGYTDSFGVRSYDIWLIKTDTDGYMEWNRTFGGPLRDYGYYVQQTADGGYIVTGESDSFSDGDYDLWAIKTDAEGNMEWDSLFGGPGIDRGRYGIQTSDGGYAFTGFTDSFGAGMEDAWLIKTDPAGNLEWDNTFGGPGEDRGRVVLQTERGGYVFAGYTSSFGRGYDDMWVVRTDVHGNARWNWTFGGAYYYDRLTSAVLDADGKLVLLGQSRLAGTQDYNILLMKLNIAH